MQILLSFRGSLVAGRKKVATEELLALFEVNKLIFNAKIKRDSCCQEFAEMCKVFYPRLFQKLRRYLYAPHSRLSQLFFPAGRVVSRIRGFCRYTSAWSSTSVRLLTSLIDPGRPRF